MCKNIVSWRRPEGVEGRREGGRERERTSSPAGNGSNKQVVSSPSLLTVRLERQELTDERIIGELGK